jgi:3-oxoacyl-[acyl-carrier-protein] synthase II
VSGSRIVASGAVSPLGVGSAAFASPSPGERAVFRGGPVAAYEARGVRRATATLVSALPRDAFGFLEHALSSCLSSLDAVLPSWPTLRVGLAIGTSSGGMSAAERLFEELESTRASGAPTLRDEVVLDATYGCGAVRAARLLTSRLDRGGGVLVRQASVLVACASSTVALGLGHLWLTQGTCDLVLAGGYDALTLFVASGFSALAAVTAERPLPFRLGRDGLALSEGAGIVALVPAGRFSLPDSVVVRGFGLSSDAVHGTAPDRTGRGVARGADRALAEAGIAAAQVELVNAHGTATPFNDAAETRALERLGWPVDEPERLLALGLHAPKGVLGHALGAAGVLETLAAVEAIQRGIFPATAGDGPIDPLATVPLRERTEVAAVNHVLKLSAAFGGANASLVLARSTAPATTPPVGIAAATSSAGRLRWSETSFVVEAAEASSAHVATALGLTLDRATRLDELARLVVRAAALALAGIGAEEREKVALVVETAYATVGRNHLYFKRILERSAALAEPRRFPGTSPNFAGGEASILLGLRGPVLTVGGDPRLPEQGRAIAEDLVRGSHAPACVWVSVEEASGAAQRIHEVWSADGTPVVSRAVAALLCLAPSVR